MNRINCNHYLHNGFAIYQETREAQRVWAVYRGFDLLFYVRFMEFDLIPSKLRTFYGTD